MLDIRNKKPKAQQRKDVNSNASLNQRHDKRHQKENREGKHDKHMNQTLMREKAYAHMKTLHLLHVFLTTVLPVQEQPEVLKVFPDLLRHLSNFTDFNMLERDERVNLYYTNKTDDLLKADIILIPGTKSTLDDLYELRRNGVAQAILRGHREATMVMGICGGYQMLGETLSDPDGVEAGGKIKGMGLLPIDTVFKGAKTRTRVEGRFLEVTGALSALSQIELECYEIHMG